MARGWESKSVEEQMASATKTPTVRVGSDGLTEEQRRLAGLERAARERQKQSLSLQREQVLSQRTSSPARRQALEAALKQIESQLEALG
jgi:hypothetical protein